MDFFLPQLPLLLKRGINEQQQRSPSKRPTQFLPDGTDFYSRGGADHGFVAVFHQDLNSPVLENFRPSENVTAYFAS